MNSQMVGMSLKGERVTVKVRNDSSSAMPLGTPVGLSLDGTEDGLAVKLPADMSTQALADIFFFGVITDATIAANAIGNSQTFGLVQKAVIRRGTRAASTDNWAGSTSIAKGVLLMCDTVNNCFSTLANASSFASTDTIASRGAFAFLAQDVASFASTGSTSGSNTALTTYAKVFVRSL